jgi:hypothetical protein
MVPFGFRSGTCTNAKCRAGFQVAMLQGPAIRHLSDGRADQIQIVQCDRGGGFSASVVRPFKSDETFQGNQSCRSEVSGTGEGGCAVGAQFHPIPRPLLVEAHHFPTWRPALSHVLIANGNFFVTAPSRGLVLLCGLVTVDF